MSGSGFGQASSSLEAAPIVGPRGYAEIAVDRIVHIVGLVFAGMGCIALIGLALHRLEPRGWWPVIVYSASLAAMLGCSAAYGLNALRSRREALRRLDHAAIFLMIAGTYTPFTTRVSPVAWAVAMTGLVWALALAGAVLKLGYPRRIERFDLALYLALGWIILVAWKPVMAVFDMTTAVLIIVGGALYTIGVVFHVWRTLPFHNAIWHSFVLVAAGCHYAAVLRGVLGLSL